MSAERSLLLSEEYRLHLALELQQAELLGILGSPDPNNWIELKSKRRSPHYMDVRKGISSPKIRHRIAQTLLELAQQRVAPLGQSVRDAYTHITGTPEAMTSYATTIADLGNLSLLQPRVATNKTSGNKTPILGTFDEGDSVAAFDDVVTDGQSKVDTIGALRAGGLEVTDYFVLLDREEGGAPQVYQETGLEIVPAMGMSSLARLLRAERKISSQQFVNVARYVERYGEDHAKETINTAI
jgi:orotate phosphoribosyltransferase